MAASSEVETTVAADFLLAVLDLLEKVRQVVRRGAKACKGGNLHFLGTGVESLLDQVVCPDRVKGVHPLQAAAVPGAVRQRQAVLVSGRARR